MRIVELKAENVKRLSAVSIKPDGSIVVIGGNNGAGKSSVLDSIWYALGGDKALPPKPLRNGTDSGRVVLDLGDFIVTKTFKRKDDGTVATKLEIKSREGYAAPSPQTILNDMCGKMAFDPLAFSRLKPKEQLEQLKELVGLDFSELDGKRTFLFEQRTECNRQLKAKKSELAACPKVDGAPDGEVSVSALMDELKRRQTINHGIEQKRRELVDEVSAHEDLVAEGTALEAEVAELKEQLAKAEQRAAENVKRVSTNLERVQKIREAFDTLKKADEEDVQRRISEADDSNKKARQNQQHAKLSAAVTKLETDSESFTKQIGTVDAAKAKTMADAKFPVDGLGFDTDGVTFNGLPFEQSSSAEQLRISVAMGIALNPKLPVMLIRDGSLLGEQALTTIAEMAQKAGAQIWIERVGKGSECSVIIEDGHVADESVTADEPELASSTASA